MRQVDRITEALQRAQEQGQQQAQPNRGPAPVKEEVLRASVVPMAERLPAGLPRSNIVYSKTRVAKVSTQELAQRRIVVDGANPALTSAVKFLRTQVVQKMRENNWRTLALVSASGNEGKTFMAVNFAVSVAMEFDQTALLVDADLRNPSVHEYFGLPGAPGLSNFLVNHTPLDHLLVNPGIERLVILPAGAPQANSAELLGSTQMAALVADIKSRYSDRIVVFDLPPVLKAADALAFAPLVDAFVLVAADGKTARDDLRRTRQLLGSNNIIGVILNKSREAFDDDGEPRTNWFQRLFRSET